MSGRLITYPTREILWSRLAASICGALCEAVDTKTSASIALPGGGTPRPLFDHMAEARAVSWSRVTVLPTDERWLPPGDPQTNEHLLRERLKVDHAAPLRLLSLRSDHATPALAAGAAGRMLAREKALPLDLCVLGLGEDGHVASLIAGATGYDSAMADGAEAVVAIHAPGAAGAADRISLSFREIRASRRVILVFLGETKRAVFEAASLSPLRELLERTSVEAHWSA